MTGLFNLILTNANQWYSLWDLIVAAQGLDFDPTFSQSPVIASEVCELKWQNQLAGSTIYRATGNNQPPNDPYTATGFITQGFAWDVDRAKRNIIELKKQYFSTDTAGAKLYVSTLAN